MIDKITKKITDLEKELKDKDDRPTAIRKKIIEEEIKDLRDKLKKPKIPTVKEHYIKEIKSFKSENKKFRKDIIPKINNINHKINFMDMYKTSFDQDIFSNDIKNINNVWSIIFQGKNIDEFDMNILFKLSDYIQINTTFDDVYKELKEFLKVVTKFASDYSELDQQLYSENYALQKIYELLSYVIKHTISINLKNIIQQLLRNELTKSTPQQGMKPETYSEYIDNKIKSIILTSKLDEYIYSSLIEKIIITTFNLDVTEKTEVKQHFDYITKLLSQNGVIPITSESEIVKTLSNNIYPYFAIYTEVNMKKLKTIINGLFNTITNLSYSLDIYEMIAEKAKTEK